MVESILESTVQTPGPGKPAKTRGTAIWVIILIVLLIVGVGVLAGLQVSARKNAAMWAAQAQDAAKRLKAAESRLNSLEEDYAKLQGESEVAIERLGLSEQEIEKARRLTSKIRKEQEARYGELTGQVGEVSAKVAEQQKSIEETMAQLQRAVGDLGQQSGLIARNSEELKALKARGEREYFDFDLKKSKHFERVGPIGIRLRKVDTKRNKFTLTLLADDKEIEKKDKTLLEPVQFYLKGQRKINELVAYEIDKNRIVGYLSVPKALPKGSAAAQAPAKAPEKAQVPAKEQGSK